MWSNKKMHSLTKSGQRKKNENAAGKSIELSFKIASLISTLVFISSIAFCLSSGSLIFLKNRMIFCFSSTVIFLDARSVTLFPRFNCSNCNIAFSLCFAFRNLLYRKPVLAFRLYSKS